MALAADGAGGLDAGPADSAAGVHVLEQHGGRRLGPRVYVWALDRREGAVHEPEVGPANIVKHHEHEGRRLLRRCHRGPPTGEAHGELECQQGIAAHRGAEAAGVNGAPVKHDEPPPGCGGSWLSPRARGGAPSWQSGADQPALCRGKLNSECKWNLKNLPLRLKNM